MGWILTIVIGLLAGLIGSAIMRNGSLGWIKNIILGLLGSIVGKWVYGFFGATADEGFWGQLIVSVVGACIILFIAGLFNRKK
ncbi:GlsB/YeaQ/YmgE family stress response membrane protein [Porphyromonas sp.]|uniref:GlsB/YeaQ/YmgE family stress response membrane protein n=1 Tax=Porphyromonas sp. TaxID=1924944 RepID=UPI0026DC71D2|nr:GlsB/YeaQ/YmgE family stress response membrane protein [Porphyromonas sp.]MDO4695348.1 GlsB/YeaQ/YmgE family stress response membrane protein [Porphyromonas sp.]MDO4771122.1 GlsB/YeaQ/YmgE family stress response membrane protein [Porphyromonas sp.]